MTQKNVEIKISADTKSAEKGFREAAKAAEQLNNQLQKAGRSGSADLNQLTNAVSKATNGVGKFSSALTAVGSIISTAVLGSVAHAIASIGVASVGAAAQIRQYEIAFSTMLKSAEEGHAMLQQLQKFAADTPFDVPGVVEAAQQLMAFGFSAEEIIPTLRNLGDTAAGLGKGTAGVQQIAYAIGQIRTSGTLKTQDINQLTNAGISAWEILAEAAGKSVMEIKEMTERGMIDSLKAVEVLTAGMEERYGGMMAKTAEEVTGLWANITEGIGTAQATMGAFLTDSLNLKNVLKSVSEAVTNMSNGLMEAHNAGKSFREAISEAVPEPVIVAVGALAALFAGAVVAGLAAAAVAAGAFVSASIPMIGTILAVSAAVGAAVTAIALYWDEIRAATVVAWNSIAGTVEGVINSVLATFFKGLEQLSYGASKLAEILGQDTKEIDKFLDSVDQALKKALKSAEDGFSNLTLKANTYADALKKIRNEHSALNDEMSGYDKAEAQRNARYIKESQSPSSNTAPAAGPVDLSFTGASNKEAQAASRAEAAAKASQQRVESLMERIARAKRETAGFGKAFEDLKANIEYAGKTGDAKALAGIEREKEARLNSLQEILEKQEAAVEEAKAFRKKAMEEENTEAIKKAEELLKSREDLLQATKDQREQITLTIDDQAAEKTANYISSVENAVISLGKSVANDFGNAISDIVLGTQSAGAAIANFARTIITNALKMAAEFAGLCGMLALFGVIPPGPIAAKMMFGIDPKHEYNKGSLGAKLAKGHATGGYISGPGTGTSDSIPAMLSNGEYVLSAHAVRNIGIPTLNAINAGQNVVPAGILATTAEPLTAGTHPNNSAPAVFQPVINISALDTSDFESFLSFRGGAKAIKQMFEDERRNFSLSSETW